MYRSSITGGVTFGTVKRLPKNHWVCDGVKEGEKYIGYKRQKLYIISNNDVWYLYEELFFI